MRLNVSLLAALAGACLTTGCVVHDPGYLPPSSYAPLPPNEIIVPRVVIVENGVRHDRHFYLRHPELYRRDRLRYPERFGLPRPHYRAPLPPPPPRPHFRAHVPPPPPRPLLRAPVAPARPAFHGPNRGPAPRPEIRTAPGIQRPDSRKAPDQRKRHHDRDNDDARR